LVAQCYEIRLLGQAGDLTTVAFSDLVVLPEPRTTLLRGRFEDQAALHGVLARCRDLGVEIIEVRAVPAADGGATELPPLPDRTVSAPLPPPPGTFAGRVLRRLRRNAIMGSRRRR
jgi:hypothetical protein